MYSCSFIAGTLSKGNLTGSQAQQIKQIHLLQKPGARPLTQKLSE